MKIKGQNLYIEASNASRNLSVLGFLDKIIGILPEDTSIFMLIGVLNSQKRYQYFPRSFKTLDD